MPAPVPLSLLFETKSPSCKLCCYYGPCYSCATFAGPPSIQSKVQPLLPLPCVQREAVLFFSLRFFSVKGLHILEHSNQCGCDTHRTIYRTPVHFCTCSIIALFFFVSNKKKLLVQTLARHKLAICIASLLFARATNLMLAKKGAINRRRSCLRGSNRCLNGTTGMTALQLWDARHTTITPRSHKCGLTKCRIREDAGGRWCVLGCSIPILPSPLPPPLRQPSLVVVSVPTNQTRH